MLTSFFTHLRQQPFQTCSGLHHQTKPNRFLNATYGLVGNRLESCVPKSFVTQFHRFQKHTGIAGIVDTFLSLSLSLSLSLALALALALYLTVTHFACLATWPDLNNLTSLPLIVTRKPFLKSGHFLKSLAYNFQNVFLSKKIEEEKSFFGEIFLKS